MPLLDEFVGDLHWQPWGWWVKGICTLTSYNGTDWSAGFQSDGDEHRRFHAHEHPFPACNLGKGSCSDDEGEDDDGDEEGGDDQKSQYGEHEEGIGDLTRQSSGALEDIDGLPAAAFRALEHVEDGPDKRRSGRLWRSAKERWMWRKDATLVTLPLTLHPSALLPYFSGMRSVRYCP